MSCDDIAGLTPDEIVAKYTDLVDRWVRKTRHLRHLLPAEDRRQEAYMGLLVAIPRFDPTRGVKFATYAGHWIHSKIMDGAWYRNTAVIRTPRAAHRRGEQGPWVVSLSTPRRGDDDDKRTLYDHVIAPEPAESIADHHDAQKLLARVRDPRDRHCLWQNVALGMQLNRVAEPLGISGERVRQLVRRALGRLRSLSRASAAG